MSPPTSEDLNRVLDHLNLNLTEKDFQDHLHLLESTEKAIQDVLSLSDFTPSVDLNRYPRTDIRTPSDDKNPLRGWACKAKVKGEEKGILKGRSLVLKDTICLAGVPCFYGTAAVDDFIPSFDATIVTRILQHGGTILGKATCEDMSHGAASFTSKRPEGPVQNPYAVGFSAGGSSSGCGALIGSGEIEMGVGGDQGGSIRIPAALCGLTGLKATFGLIPYTGVLPSESSLDHIGPMALAVRDIALLLGAIAGYDGIDDRQLGAPNPEHLPSYIVATELPPKNPLIGIKIGVLKEGFESRHLSKEVENVVRNAIERLTELGAEVVDVSAPLHLKADSIMHVINKVGSSQTRLGRATGRRGVYVTEFYEALGKWDQERWGKVHSFVRGTAISGEYTLQTNPSAYGRAVNLIRKLKLEYDALLLDKVDVLVMPTVPCTARRHPPEGREAPVLESIRKTAGLTVNTAPFNGTGHPALTIPIGLAPPSKDDILAPEDENIRLPVGMQIVGPWWGEEKCLRVGAAWEQGWEWKTGERRE
ncbi:amidase signature enzyme [Marasmius fiardii PR-910]|nr:amidase signature enzyme [Marasmius fiardii PR-910]